MTAHKKHDNWLWADWPAPKNIHAGTSLRTSGFSLPPFKGFNLAQHVNDNEHNVAQNRKKLIKNLSLKSTPIWLNQTHSKDIISIDELPENRDADGAITTTPNRVCVVLTADCVPVLFCNQSGTKIAAVHAGWKGICNGIIENAINMYTDPSSLLVWIGPCISQKYYEVGNDLYNACLSHSDSLKGAFQTKNDKHWYCNLSSLVKITLKNNGVGAIYECGLCTYKEQDLFYSYRRDGITGRTASMIWME